MPNKKYKDQSEQVRSFFDSEEFKKANDLDIPLWHGANKLLDLQVSPSQRDLLICKRDLS